MLNTSLWSSKVNKSTSLLVWTTPSIPYLTQTNWGCWLSLSTKCHVEKNPFQFTSVALSGSLHEISSSWGSLCWGAREEVSVTPHGAVAGTSVELKCLCPSTSGRSVLSLSRACSSCLYFFLRKRYFSPCNRQTTEAMLHHIQLHERSWKSRNEQCS